MGLVVLELQETSVASMGGRSELIGYLRLYANLSCVLVPVRSGFILLLLNKHSLILSC